MAYRLQLEEPILAGVRRIAADELQSAAKRLSATVEHEESAAEAIHEARKSVKKIRAMLRLFRPDPGAFASEDKKLREAGRKLARLRDAEVLLEVFDGVVRKYPGELSQRTAATFRRRLAARKIRIDGEAKAGRLLERVCAKLEAGAIRSETWPLPIDGVPAIASGLEAAFHRARKAMKYARRHPEAENFHRWRKRVQDHLYQTRLLSNFYGDSSRARARNLKTLQTQLGDDHNLEVLRQTLAPRPRWTAAIPRYQNDLRSSALALGDRIYAEGPPCFSPPPSPNR